MGMVGCYDAHFYCDCCNEFSQVAQVETYEEAIEAAQKGNGGWLFRADGVILCETCKDIENPTLIPENKREGSVWNWKTTEAQERGHEN